MDYMNISTLAESDINDIDVMVDDGRYEIMITSLGFVETDDPTLLLQWLIAMSDEVLKAIRRTS